MNAGWLAVGALAVAALAAQSVLHAQASAPAAAAKPAAAAQGRAGGAAPARARVHGNLNQVMRGILFPNSNVVFASQSTDPATIKQDKDPSLSTDPLRSVYGGWTAVEDAGYAIAESANLLTIPGRVCSNGKPAPVGNADWAKFVAGLRDAGMEVVKAAKAKNQDAMLDVSDKMTSACSACHDVYREKTDKQGGLAARCTK
jgi:cytochrome c553